MLGSLTGVSVRSVKMPAGIVAGPLRLHFVLDRLPWGISYEYIFISAPLYAYYDYCAKLIGVIKLTQDWTFCFAHCHCVTSNVHSRRQRNETFCTMTKGTYNQPNSGRCRTLCTTLKSQHDHWRTHVQQAGPISHFCLQCRRGAA